MNERLIGEKIAIDVPCSIESSSLLSSFAEELIEVGGGEPAEPDQAEKELFALIEALCADVAARGPVSDGKRLEVVLRVTETGVEISLRCAYGDIADRHYTLEEA